MIVLMLTTNVSIGQSSTINGVPGQSVVNPLASTLNYFAGIMQTQQGSNSIINGVHFGGDSNATATGLQGTPVAFTTQFCKDTGITPQNCVNNALQGNTCADVVFKAFTTELPTELSNPLQVHQCGSNESDTGTENTTAQYVGLVQGILALGSYLTSPPSETFLAFANATLTGSYATDSSTFVKSKGVKTSTTGSAEELVVVGKSSTVAGVDYGTLYCWVYNYTSSTGVYQMLDTSTPANTALTDVTTNTSTFNSLGIGRAPGNLGTTWPIALKFSLTTGIHRIKQNVTTSGPTGFIGCSSPNVNNKHGQGSPIAVIGNTIPEQYNNYATAVVNTNTNMALATTTLIQDGYSIIPWNSYANVNTTTDFDSKSAIGFIITATGSGQTDNTYTEQAATDSCAGGPATHIWWKYKISGGQLVSAQPTIVPGTTTSYAQGCTGTPTFTISHGGTPGTATVVMSTNTGYNNFPPYHLSQLGHYHLAQGLEAVVQAALLPTSNGGSSSVGSQTLDPRARYVLVNGTGVSITEAASGIAGTCWSFANGNGSNSASFTGGGGGNLSGYVMPPMGGVTACDYDGSGIISITGVYNPNALLSNVAMNITTSGAASVSPVLMSGTVLTVGSGTTSFPMLFMQPNGTTAATTWSTAGTFFGVNAASGFGGNFIDLHLGGGTSLFKVTSGGSITNSGSITAGGDITSGGKVTLSSILQNAASKTGGTCTMSAGTSCTITIATTYTTPLCFATVQSTSLTGTYSGCTVSGTTVTVTAGVANSLTWAALVIGNPN